MIVYEILSITLLVKYFIYPGGKDGILNPMVHNMTPAYEAAKYDLVWVSTSRIAGKYLSTFFML